MDARAIVLTGISASGKTTVGRLLADSFPRGAFVSGDVIRTMVRSGRADMSQDPSAEALAQLRLRYRQTAELVNSFCAAGFTTVADDVIIGRELAGFLDAVHARPLHLVVLDPSIGAITERDRERDKTGYGTQWTVEALHDVLASETPKSGLWLDTSAQSPDRTVAEIRSRLAESRLER